MPPVAGNRSASALKRTAKSRLARAPTASTASRAPAGRASSGTSAPVRAASIAASSEGSSSRADTNCVNPRASRRAARPGAGFDRGSCPPARRACPRLRAARRHTARSGCGRGRTGTRPSGRTGGSRQRLDVPMLGGHRLADRPCVVGERAEVEVSARRLVGHLGRGGVRELGRVGTRGRGPPGRSRARDRCRSRTRRQRARAPRSTLAERVASRPPWPLAPPGARSVVLRIGSTPSLDARWRGASSPCLDLLRLAPAGPRGSHGVEPQATLIPWPARP